MRRLLPGDEVWDVVAEDAFADIAGAEAHVLSVVLIHESILRCHLLSVLPYRQFGLSLAVLRLRFVFASSLLEGGVWVFQF